MRLEAVPGSDVARVHWEGESPWIATELLQAQPVAASGERRSAIAEARAWLREVLADEPRPAKALRADAARCGIGSNALTAARRAAGVSPHQVQVARGH